MEPLFFGHETALLKELGIIYIPVYSYCRALRIVLLEQLSLHFSICYHT
jgi:hypothetical protein